MKPTPELRYIEREIWMAYENRDDVQVKRAIRILQQRWIPEDADRTLRHFKSEWRDVPIEKE